MKSGPTPNPVPERGKVNTLFSRFISAYYQSAGFHRQTRRQPSGRHSAPSRDASQDATLSHPPVPDSPTAPLETAEDDEAQVIEVSLRPDTPVERRNTPDATLRLTPAPLCVRSRSDAGCANSWPARPLPARWAQQGSEPDNLGHDPSAAPPTLVGHPSGQRPPHPAEPG